MNALPIFAGPLAPLLEDAEVTAIHIVEQIIQYEKHDELRLYPFTFESTMQLRLVVASILSAGNVTLSASNPVVQCELADGTQVHAEHDPLLLSLHKRTD